MATVKSDDKWEVDDAVRTLIRSQEILNDKKLLPKVKRAFAEKQRALADAALELKVSTKQKDIRNKKD